MTIDNNKASLPAPKVGDTWAGMYKSPNREEVTVVAEIQAVVKVDRNGEAVTGLVAIRKDARSRGSVQFLYAERFWPDTVKATPTPDFKALPGLAEGEWYLTQISLQYGQVERVKTEAGLKHLPEGAQKIVIA